MIFSFEITHIKAGWFDVALSNGDKEVTISDSYYMGTSNQGTFLKSIAALADCIDCEKWLLWNDEPGGYIWHLHRIGEVLHYQVSISEKDAYQIYSQDLSKAAISEVLIAGDVEYIRFLRVVMRAFALYSKDEPLAEYEKEWGAFPHEELALVADAIQKTKSN